jgi:membrane fusion protein (multidrug efflux system)
MRRTTATKTAITLVGLLLLVGIPTAVKISQFVVMGSTPMVTPPETVTADLVRREQWPRTVDAVGSLVAVQGVTVAVELDGKIAKIAFESGDHIKAGDLLVQLDTSTEEAQLRSAEAAADLARANLERNRELLATRTASKADFDSANAQFKQAVAQADNVRSLIAKKTLRAPFSGRLGLRLVNLGQIVKAGDPVATLQTLDPIYVNFSVPQQRLALLALRTAVRVSTDAAPGKVFTGKINAVNPEIDPATRSVRVQATISNADEALRPGMFADVEVVLPHEEEVLAIPATAVLYAPYGDSVFVVEDKKDDETGQATKVLRQQIVRLGNTRGDFVSVVSGLKAGELVVTTGAFKLRANTTVVVDNTLAPKAQLAPHPANE